MTTTEIELRQQDSLAEKIEWSKAMATGDMLPRQYRGNPANLMFACEYADALGIPRINALTSIHVIDGKPHRLRRPHRLPRPQGRAQAPRRRRRHLRRGDDHPRRRPRLHPDARALGRG
ncbi:hypothetical protein GS532_22600 [Rhodococcus hoagii]|nr:hypothetical protein [Prescottella equi]